MPNFFRANSAQSIENNSKLDYKENSKSYKEKANLDSI